MRCKQLENTLAIIECIRYGGKESSLEPTMTSILSYTDANFNQGKGRTTELFFVARFSAQFSFLYIYKKINPLKVENKCIFCSNNKTVINFSINL